MKLMSVARNQRGALTQAGAGIAASRRKSTRFRAAIRVCGFPGATGTKETDMSRLLTRVAVAATLAALVSGCALTARRSTVQEIKYNPGRYNDRKVAIDGVVTSSFGLPLVPFRLYKVDDGTGEVTVISQGARTPTRGAHVRVTGRVSDVATFGGSSLGLHIRETDLDFRR
jgi:predicted DNA-binding ribbon-helix-helix protein